MFNLLHLKGQLLLHICAAVHSLFLLSTLDFVSSRSLNLYLVVLASEGIKLVCWDLTSPSPAKEQNGNSLTVMLADVRAVFEQPCGQRTFLQKLKLTQVELCDFTLAEKDGTRKDWDLRKSRVLFPSGVFITAEEDQCGGLRTTLFGQRKVIKEKWALY